MPRAPSRHQSEIFLALVLTVIVASLHFINGTSAGGLWRDEANTLGLATLPTVTEVWKNIQYDSFPVLWPLVVRGFTSIAGNQNDDALRALGVCVGLGIVGAIWFYARTFRNPAPIVALVLLAMQPAVIRYGDSMRAYGFGMMLMLLTAAVMWRFIRTPRPATFIATTALAILSVQTLYYNSVILAAICFGAFAVSALRREWRTAAMVVLIGAIAAITLIPYLDTVRASTSWAVAIRIPDYTIAQFISKLTTTLRLGGRMAALAWMAASALGVAAALSVLLRSRDRRDAETRDVIVFNLVTLVVSVIGIFLFLDYLSYSTEHWYYLSLISIAGVCIDTLLRVSAPGSRARIFCAAAVIVVAGTTFLPARRVARTLVTTVDIVADSIEKNATPNDFVIVDEWYVGVTFFRYYHGKAPWATIPPLAVHRVHRPDMLMAAMRQGDQEQPVKAVIDKIENTLRSGHSVFLVGELQVPPEGTRPTTLPQAPWNGKVWPMHAFEKQWSSMVGYALTSHSAEMSEPRLLPPTIYNVHEWVKLTKVSGWRQDPTRAPATAPLSPD